MLVGVAVTGTDDDYFVLKVYHLLPASLPYELFGGAETNIFNIFAWVSSVGYPVLGVGLTALGVIALPRRALGRWSALPLLMGVLTASAFFISLEASIIWLSDTPTKYLAWIILTILFDLFLGACWLAVGAALRRKSRATALGAAEQNIMLHLPPDGQAAGAGA